MNERLIEALERIATALEAQNAADPLTMLNMALEQEGAGEGLPGDPQPPFASNGITHVYQHPDKAFHIVARPSPYSEGGYRVDVEPA